MFIGICFALMAGALWGLIFIGPAWVPDYPAILLSVGRYLAFGLVSIPLAWQSRRRLQGLQKSDWWCAIRLVLIGQFVYYWALSNAIQKLGVPLATMINGTLPVLITVAANWRYRRRDGLLPWPALIPPFILIILGLVSVNAAELLRGPVWKNPFDYYTGLVSAAIALACWTWYPLSNADWLRQHADKRSSTWATAQGLVTLPIAIIGTLLVYLQLPLSTPSFQLPLGPTPAIFVGLMLAFAICCSWLGAICWNKASQRLPTAMMGPLVLSETVAGLTYSFLWRQEWPSFPVMLGIVCLTLGVFWVLKLKPKVPASPSTSASAH